MDFTIPVTEDIGFIFPSPVLLRQIPDFEPVNEGLKAQILAAMEKDEGVKISNRGGWQSSPDLWNWNTPRLDILTPASFSMAARICACRS